MSLDLRHYSHAPIDKLGTSPYKPYYFGSKPEQGLWVSVEGNGDGWKDWCVEQRSFLDSILYEHKVVLKDDANILHLSSPSELREFTKSYKGESELNSSNFVRSISWSRLAKVYQGIIISPYLWECRLDYGTFWYYGWDCASGCIWDISVIESIELITPSLVER